jgi:hypothetical protein
MTSIKGKPPGKFKTLVDSPKEYGAANTLVQMNDSGDGVDYTAAPKNIDSINFDTTATPPMDAEGTIAWSADDHTVNIQTGLGPVLQTGQELYTIVYNDTLEDIGNAKVVKGVGILNDRITIEKAQADTSDNLGSGMAITTMVIPSKDYGIVTKFGNIRGVDTTSYSPSPVLYVSADTAGELTNVRPEFPNYTIQVGAALNFDADGTISIDLNASTDDTFNNAWNGTFRESFDFRISSDGATVTGTLSPSNGHPDLTMNLNDGFSIFDTSPGATIELTPGTDANPQTNYVYIPASTKVLTVSTSAWPESFEHIRVAQIYLQSAASTQSEGALRNQNWNDHLTDGHTFQGHLAHLGAKLRQFDSQWDYGCEATISIVGGAVSVKSTSGSIYQMHPQSFPAHDMTQYTIDAVDQGAKTFTISGDGDLSSINTVGKLISVHDSTGNDGLYTINTILWSTPDFIITVAETIPSAVADGTIGDDIHVVNNFAGAYTEVTDLAAITTDATGNPLNNTSFSIVVWGASNKGGEASHLMANMPLSTYNKNFPEQAVADADAAAVYTIPKEFRGVGFLIARFTFVNSGGTWSLYETQDLRGFLPNTTAGAGAGSSGITTFLGLTDTPSSFLGQASNIARINAAENALEFTSIIEEKTSDYTATIANTGKIWMRTDLEIPTIKTVIKHSDGAGGFSYSVRTLTIWTT